MIRTPNNIIVIWQTVEGYEPQPFHFFRADEIDKARAFAAYAIEKDYDDNTKAHYTINFYEKVLTSQTNYDKIKEPTKTRNANLSVTPQ